MPRYDESIPLAEAVRRVFADVDATGIHELLQGARDHEGRAHVERVLLACVLLSAGDTGRLRHYLTQAKMDSRDVLYWAFYYEDEPPEHMRAFLA